jgi:tetratricopeptide (TPR) repeat protein
MITRTLLTLLATLLLFSTPPKLYAEPDEPHQSASRTNDNNEKKLEQARKSYEMFPLNEELKHNLAEGYASTGYNFFKQRQFEKADEQLVKAIELYPDEPAYALIRGICSYNLKKYDIARYELERVRSQQPESVEALIYLGLVLYETDTRLEAVQLWEQALKLAPGRKDTVQLLDKARKEATVEEKMDRGNSSRFNLTYDPGVPTSFALAVLDVLESASNQVGSELGHFPAARVPVVIYKRNDYKTITNSPDWSGGAYDGTIRLPFGALSEISAGLRSVLFHEYAHVVVFDLTKGNCPIWLNEGIAEMFGRKQLSDSKAANAQTSIKGAAVDIRKLEGSFTGLSSADANIVYQQSYSLVNYVVTAYGWHRIQQILSELGRGASINDAIASTLKSYNLSYDGLVNEWQDAMMREGSGR